MKKYASQFNELIVLAEKEKTKKKGGSMAAVLKLVQDLSEFESNIQETIDAQEMAENRAKIEAFLIDIDKMYEILLDMAKASIQAMRSERTQPPVEETEQVEEKEVVKDDSKGTSFSTDDLQKQLDAKPKSPVSVNIPKVPTM
jgi:hypothetical protein